MEIPLKLQSNFPLAFPVLVILLCTYSAQAQLTVTPSLPGPDDSVTVLFDASQGNAALAGWSGGVYIHSGVLTASSVDSSDWKYVSTPWGSSDSQWRMDSIGADLYRYRYHVADFYGLPPGLSPTHLAFVFRNATGSVVGRDADGSDMFWAMSVDSVEDFSYLAHEFYGDRLVVHAGPYHYGFRFFRPGLLEMRLLPDSAGALPWPVTLSVAATPAGGGAVTDLADRLEFGDGILSAVVRKNPFSVAVVQDGDTLLGFGSPLQTQGDGSVLSFGMDGDASWQGGGSRAIPVDRSGRVLDFWNTQAGGYGYGADPMNIAIPFLVSSQGLGVYFDHEGRSECELGAVHADTLRYSVQSEEAVVYFVAGPGYDSILASYTALTGRAMLPPRWALGYIQSKFGYRNQAAAENTVAQLRSNGFPIDALVLDLYWFGDPSDMGRLDWDLAAFPDPSGMMSDLRDDGVQTVLITEPYFHTSTANFGLLDALGYLATDGGGSSYVIGGFWTGPSGLLDLTDSVARSWMWSQYDNLLADGVGGWWCDLGEPETHPLDMVHAGGSAERVHNRFSLDWAELIREGYAVNHPGIRLFNLIRSGSAGMQRMGTFPWSGDVQRSWSGLEAQIPIMLGMGMSGVGYMHSDMGGFTGGSFNQELYLRWLQFAVFGPVVRAHGVDNIPTEPYALAEPYRSIARRFLRLRYRMLPYNYSLAWRNAKTGSPLARPMDWYDPGDALLRGIDDQFYWGDKFVVAPILQEGVTSRDVVLPPGPWIDYWTGAHHTGPATISAFAPLNRIPLFVRGGALIPMAGELERSSDWDAGHLHFAYWPDYAEPASSGSVYLDDGADPGAAGAGQISADAQVGATSIQVRFEGTAGSWTGAVSDPEVLLQVIGVGEPGAVTVDGSDWALVADSAALVACTGCAWYDATGASAWVKFRFAPGRVVVLENTTVGIQADAASHVAFAAPAPNPFSERTQWSLELTTASSSSMRIVGIDGRVVADWGTRVLQPGGHSFSWDGRDPSGRAVPAGIYYLDIRVGTARSSFSLVRVGAD